MINEVLQQAAQAGATTGLKILDLGVGGILLILVLDRVLGWTIKWRDRRNGKKAEAQAWEGDNPSRTEQRPSRPPCAYLEQNVLHRDKVTRIEAAVMTMTESMKDLASTTAHLSRNSEQQTQLMGIMSETLVKLAEHGPRN